MLSALTPLYDDTPFTSDTFLDKLFPDFWSFIINLIALVVLFVAVYLLAYKPVKKLINARKDYVEHNLRDSEQAKAVNEAKAKASDQLIDDAKKEASLIISKAKTDATTAAQQIVEDAKTEAVAREKAADEAIKQEEVKARRAIHDEIVNVALDASKQVLSREVNQEDNAKLVGEFADKMEDAKRG